jgi:hypothetical protein
MALKRANTQIEGLQEQLRGQKQSKSSFVETKNGINMTNRVKNGSLIK